MTTIIVIVSVVFIALGGIFGWWTVKKKEKEYLKEYEDEIANLNDIIKDLRDKIRPDIKKAATSATKTTPAKKSTKTTKK